MANKNLLIGYGETLTQDIELKKAPGPKKHPYSVERAKFRLKKQLQDVIADIAETPVEVRANNEIVAKMTLHPAYFAKSYYPGSLLRSLNLNSVGSKAVIIEPEAWATKNHPDEATTTCLYVSGFEEGFVSFLTSLSSSDLPKNFTEDLRKIESIEYFSGSEKIKQLENNAELYLEVVLHTPYGTEDVLGQFVAYVDSLSGKCITSKRRIVQGLTFLPVVLDKNQVEAMSAFTFCRVVRSMPELRIIRPTMTRSVESAIGAPIFPDHDVNESPVAIFDGGISSDTLDRWVTEYVYDMDTPPQMDCVEHGGQVTSAYLFGPIQDEMLPKPYTPVDHFRVLDSGVGSTLDLFDVLTRVTTVLDRNAYKFINLSLGPRLPIDDDDVHVWTSVLDEYLSAGNTFATVAVGNDGQARAPNNRVQPPSDMVNAVGIGSSDHYSDDWRKADYSCVGPGRSPGLVKPDGVYFGGSARQPFVVFTPIANSLSGVSGTSFSAPSVLRLAAGVDATLDHELSVPAIKALLIHKTQDNGEDLSGVGWGKFPNEISEIIACSDNEATVLYQGVLRQSQFKRAFLPLPDDIEPGMVNITATFCYCSSVDPEHPVNYTRSGLVVTFRPHMGKFKPKAKTPTTQTFFSLNNLYPTEQTLRDDAHKWETTLHSSQSFRSTSLMKPCFDINYQAREKGAAPSQANDPLPYALIVTISSKKDMKLYNKVLQAYSSLQSLETKQSVRIVGHG
ncbi:MAG: S8 family peptidase [Pseudomonadota bacterium]